MSQLCAARPYNTSKDCIICRGLKKDFIFRFRGKAMENKLGKHNSLGVQQKDKQLFQFRLCTALRIVAVE